MADTKTKILEAASALFLKGGATALSVRAIAARAGISTIGIYSHFNGKQGILDALFIEAAGLVSATMDAGDHTGDPKQALMAAAGAYLDFAKNHAAHYRLFFGETDPDYTPSKEAQDAARDAYRKLLRNAALVAPQGANPEDVEKTALAFWAQLHGFVGLTRHSVADHVPVENWRDFILKTMARHLDNVIRDAADAG